MNLGEMTVKLRYDPTFLPLFSVSYIVGIILLLVYLGLGVIHIIYALGESIAYMWWLHSEIQIN